MSLFAPTIRNKLIVFTVIPVIVVYVILYAFGIPHVRDQARMEAQRHLIAHARYQAARLSLELSKIPLLASGLGDLIATAPDQPQTTLYAYLIDGLRRTPLASSASLRYQDGERTAQMRRGAPAGTTVAGGSQPNDFERGWQQLPGLIRFMLPAIKQSRTLGYVWVDLVPEDIHQLLESARSPGIMLFFDGATRPGGDDPGLGEIIRQTRNMTPDQTYELRDPQTHATYWLVNTALPGLPLNLAAIIPTETALAPVRRQVGRVTAALLLSLVAIVGIIGAVARKLTRPLQILDDSVQRIGAGDFDAAPATTSDDELGRLGDAIGRMARLLARREQQLQTGRQILEKRVAERTQALQSSNQQLLQQIRETRATEKALRLAKTEAEQASRAKTDFLSNISHELRTPLHGILGNTQLLRREGTHDPAQHESLLAIERCGQHLLGLINQLLDLTKIEAGRAEPEMKDIDLRRLLEDVRLIMHQRAAKKGIELNVEMAANLPPRVVTDPLKLKQVLLNLVDNAVKFTEHGSIVLRAEPTGANLLQFSVCDTGEGIPADQTERVFEAFHQHVGERRPEGAGLGLAINKRLVAQLQGDSLPVESQPGIGSRFAFRIPHHPSRESATSVASENPSSDSPDITGPGLPRCRILVVDPDPDNRDAIGRQLNLHDNHVVACATLQEAFGLLNDQSFDVVAVDIQGSGDRQKAIANALRAVDANEGPRLIAMGTDATEGAAQRAAEAGYCGFLAKPFNAQQLAGVSSVLATIAGCQCTEQRPTAAPRPSQWPTGLAKRTGESIMLALQVGDIGKLPQIAASLAAETDVPAADLARLRELARDFDIDGLRRFAETLQNGQQPLEPQ